MPTLGQLLAQIDNSRRVVGRNLSDLVTNPEAYLDVAGNRAVGTLADAIYDPASYVGGRVKFLGRGGHEFSAPTQADLAGRLYSIGAIGPKSAGRIYRMRNELGGEIDPELLRLIEDEAVRKGRRYAD